MVSDIATKKMTHNNGPLKSKKCVPCEDKTPPLSHNESVELQEELDTWSLVEDIAIEKTLKFKDFKEAIAFVRKVADIAETEGHHPDISIHDYNKVTFRLSTHSIGGLSENDFILAAKIDAIRA